MIHTPGPWTVSADGCGIENAEEHIGACNATYMRENPLPGQTIGIAGSSHLKNFPNAAHIVRCVNAHDDLVAALRELCADKYLADPINSERMAKARAALAKVQS